MFVKTGEGRKERALQGEETLVSAITTTTVSKMEKPSRTMVKREESASRALAGTVGWEVRVGKGLGGGGKR